MLKLQKLTEKTFSVFALLLMSGALLPFLLGSNADTGQGNPRAQAMWAGIYLVAFFLILVRGERFLYRFFYVATRNTLVWLLLGIAFISVVWSVAPGITLRNSIALAGTTVFGAYLATRYSLKELLQLLAWALGIAALLSLLCVLILPSYGISTDYATAGAWQGVYGHKQSFGKSMTLSTMVFFILAVSSRRHRWIAGALCILSLGLVWFSDSAGALLLVFAFLALWPLYKALRWRYTLATAFLLNAVLVGMVAAWLLSANAETVLGALGRDLSLTGRRTFWPYVLDMIWERPWLGYGYSAFWLGWEGPSSQVWLASGQTSSSAHNAILNLWLQLGVLGVLVFVLSTLWAFLRAVAWARYTRAAEGLWPLAFLTFFILNGTVESTGPSGNSINWTLYVAATLTTIYQHRQYSRVANDTGHIKQTSSRTSEAKIPGELT